MGFTILNFIILYETYDFVCVKKVILIILKKYIVKLSHEIVEVIHNELVPWVTKGPIISFLMSLASNVFYKGKIY